MKFCQCRRSRYCADRRAEIFFDFLTTEMEGSVEIPSVHRLYVRVENSCLQLCFLRPKPKERRRDRSFLLMPPPSLDPCSLVPFRFIGPPPLSFESVVQKSRVEKNLSFIRERFDSCDIEVSTSTPYARNRISYRVQ